LSCTYVLNCNRGNNKHSYDDDDDDNKSQTFITDTVKYRNETDTRGYHT